MDSISSNLMPVPINLNLSNYLSNRRMLTIVCIPILFAIIYVIWSQRELYYYISSDTDIMLRLDEFMSSNNRQLNDTNSPSLTYSIFNRFIRKKTRIRNIRTNHFNAYVPHIIKPKMSSIQHTINKYINELSSKDFNTFNKDIVIDKITFKHLSFTFMFSAICNKTIWFHGDSFVRKFWRYIAFVMRHKYVNDTSNMEIASGEKGIMTHLLNEENNNSNISLSLTMSQFNAKWLLAHEMDKIGIANKDTYTIRNVQENTWYTILEKYFIKLILTAHTLNQNPFIYTAQFNHLNNYLSLEPKSTLDVLFINFQALHLTHLLPARKFEKFAIETIKNLEKHFDKVIQLAIGNGLQLVGRNNSNESNGTSTQTNKVKCVIFRPPNPICLNKYNKNWVSLSDFFENDILNMSDSEIRNHSKIIQCLKNNNIDGDKVYYYNNQTGIKLRGVDICSKYTITNVGVQEIDNRIKKYVFAKQNRLYNQYAIKLIYYDQLKLFTNYCNKTYDGRHYIELLPVETMAVFNIIEKWC